MLFDADNWAEIFSVIKKNKLRTFLTGFSISWGIFMFCILLASGNGLKNGVTSNFSGQSKNSVNFWGRTTSKPYQGFSDKRQISLDQNDINLIKEQIPEADEISGEIDKSVTVNYNTFSTDCQFMGVFPAYL